ncbi:MULTISPECIES: P-loop NTPase fold protein [Actinosynnema]|uniref:P-loop NTPase fold protein n=1 Tax=Actinosynnema TaxID=40566 RepID=UPI0020A4AF00|nr:P-loop NTPase fold protein [Actinosynnema pretiosum]
MAEEWETDIEDSAGAVARLVERAVREVPLPASTATRLRAHPARRVLAVASEEWQAYHAALLDLRARRTGVRSWRTRAGDLATGALVLLALAGVVLYDRLGEPWSQWEPAAFIGFLLLVSACGLRYLARSDQADAVKAAHAAWLDALHDRGVLPAAAEASNPAPHHSTRMAEPATSFFGPDTVVDIDTPAAHELRRLLKRGRGAYALAGPRGVGKTTMLGRWCAGHYAEQDGPLLAVRVDAPVDYQPRDFLGYLFGALCDAVERWAPAPARVRSPRRTGDRLTPAHLGTLARRHRDRLRHLRSTTAERETGGDFTLGIKWAVKGKRSVKHDDVPLSHPELVDEFRRFLRQTAEVLAADGGRVVVGVDELDRIGDAEQAQRFLNEVKAVFTVDNCFFLVAVSDDALADFELSAMGARSAFDSAFDAVVRLDYLDFPQARALLNRRVVNLPEQFAALAYVLSGGLARELVRHVEVIGARPGTLAEATAHAASRHLDRYLHAAADRLVRLPDRKAGAALIPLLDERPAPHELRAYRERVEETEVGAAAEGLRDDIVALLEHLTTLVAVFGADLDASRLATGLRGGPGGFESLARVRRYLGANPYAAGELLTAFRRAWN